jgi:hypothetical protein
MDQRRRNPPSRAALIFFRSLFFLLGILGKVLIGWIFIIWQWKDDAAFLYDVRNVVYFLFPDGRIAKGKWYRVLTFHNTSVGINYRNVCFKFTRWRDEMHVSVAQSGGAGIIYRLTDVISALDSTDAFKMSEPRGLGEWADLIRPRLDEINEAFSESNFPEFKKKLPNIVRRFKSEAEWERKKRSWQRNV